MSKGYIIDIFFGIGVLLLLVLLIFIKSRERDRIEKRRKNSVGEKYMQLMAVFMRGESGRLIGMSENRAEMGVVNDDGNKEILTISQNTKGVNVQWIIVGESIKLARVFEFDSNETQEVIMKAIADGIRIAKNET